MRLSSMQDSGLVTRLAQHQAAKWPSGQRKSGDPDKPCANSGCRQAAVRGNRLRIPMVCLPNRRFLGRRFSGRCQFKRGPSCWGFVGLPHTARARPGYRASVATTFPSPGIAGPACRPWRAVAVGRVDLRHVATSGLATRASPPCAFATVAAAGGGTACLFRRRHLARNAAAGKGCTDIVASGSGDGGALLSRRIHGGAETSTPSAATDDAGAAAPDAGKIGGTGHRCNDGAAGASACRQHAAAVQQGWPIVVASGGSECFSGTRLRAADAARRHDSHEA